ncbi:MAG TPA: hypothetical protein VM884_01460, partial [Flavisolibacter sp.]|nr:hypothetical protein [Flavisolibacter sp.]
MKYPGKLSSAPTIRSFTFSETEVAKLYTGATCSHTGPEAEKMKFTNSVNDLIATFIHFDDREC